MLFLDALSEVQDVLGQINDVAVAHHLLDELGGIPEISGHSDAIDLARGWIAHDLSHLFAALPKSLRHFMAQSAFWGK